MSFALVVCLYRKKKKKSNLHINPHRKLHNAIGMHTKGWTQGRKKECIALGGSPFGVETAFLGTAGGAGWASEEPLHIPTGSGDTAAGEEETESGFRDHHMGTACAAAALWLPSMGSKQQSQSGGIWAHRERMERAVGGSMPLPPR